MDLGGRLLARFVGLGHSVLSMMEGKRRCLGLEQACPDWSGIPLNILKTIAGLIDGVEDYLRFGAVCKSWKSATFSSYDDCPKSSKRRLEYPWLMLVQSNTGETKRGFYSLHTGKEFYLDLPECHDRVCFGTSCGRLVTIGPDWEMHLLNPLTRKRIPLPSLTTTYKPRRGFPNSLLYCVFKALVVWDGDTPIVFIVYTNAKLAMARFGDSSWTHVDSGINNIELFRGQVLALTVDKIHMVDLSLSPPGLKEFSAAPFPYPPFDPSVFVVDVGGDLHAIVPINTERRTFLVKDGFVVFKLDMVGRSWKRVHSLGGWTAFVGRNSSFALPSSTHYPLCRPNSIYFTEEIYIQYHTSAGCDFGIFIMNPRSDEEIEEEGDGIDYYLNDLNAMSKISIPISDQYSTFCPPLWLAPNVW